MLCLLLHVGSRMLVVRSASIVFAGRLRLASHFIELSTISDIAHSVGRVLK